MGNLSTVITQQRFHHEVITVDRLQDHVTLLAVSSFFDDHNKVHGLHVVASYVAMDNLFFLSRFH